MLAPLSIQQQSTKLYLAHKRDLQQNPWLQQLNSLIEEQLDSFNNNIPQLAAALYMSERQFFRKVKKYTGMTPNDYLKERRLLHAKKLSQTGLYETLKELAYAVGYKRPDYFAKLFEQRFQVHPLALLTQW